MNYLNELKQDLAKLNYKWFLLQKRRYVKSKEKSKSSLNEFCWLDDERHDKYNGYFSHDEFEDFDAFSFIYTICDKLKVLLEATTDMSRQVIIINVTVDTIKDYLLVLADSNTDIEYQQVIAYISNILTEVIKGDFESVIEAERISNLHYKNDNNFTHPINKEISSSKKVKRNNTGTRKRKSIKPSLKNINNFFKALLHSYDPNDEPIITDKHTDDIARMAKQLENLFLSQKCSTDLFIDFNWNKTSIDFIFHKLFSYQTQLTPNTLAESNIITISGKKYNYNRANASKLASSKNELDMKLVTDINILFNEYTIQSKVSS